jgi:triacylglycerol lipase
MDPRDGQAAVRPVVGRAARSRSGLADYPLHAIFEQVGPGHVATIDARLRELTMPTLIVWGTADRALNPAAAAVYTAAMPRAQVVRLDGVGHLPMIEAPRETAEAYLEFRAGLGG